MAINKKDKLLKQIEEVKTMAELVELGHSIEKKDKEIDKAIREKMNFFLAEIL